MVLLCFDWALAGRGRPAPRGDPRGRLPLEDRHRSEWNGRPSRGAPLGPPYPRSSRSTGGPSDLLAKGALAYGFSTDLWTIPRIIQVTEAESGVRFTDSAMWRLLQRHGLSWQRPRRQAREKDLRAVKNWRHRSWPRYKKKPDGEGQSSCL